MNIKNENLVRRDIKVRINKSSILVLFRVSQTPKTEMIRKDSNILVSILMEIG